jgi:hypothetical protein
MKKSLVAALSVAAIASLGFASTSYASPAPNHDLGTLDITDIRTPGGLLYYYFLSGNGGDLTVGFTSSAGSKNFSYSAFQLFDNTTSTTVAIDTNSFTKIGDSWFSSVGAVLTTGDTYEFRVNLPPPGSSSSFSYSVGIVAPAAPEISTLVMMLAGFGALGLAGHRRKAATVVA